MRPKSQGLLTLTILSILSCSRVLGQELNIETFPGLYITTFETPRGRITVYLPDGVAVGDTISGTVILEAAGNTQDEQNVNRKDLNGYMIELEKEKIPLTKTKLKLTIPSTLTAGAIFLIIRDKIGNEQARTVVPVRATTTLAQQPKNPSPWEYQCPMVGRAGKPIQILGPFDGNFDTTDLRIGGKEVKLIAESPRKLVFESPKDVMGPTQIELKESAVIVKRGFNNLRVVKIGEESRSLPTSKQSIKAGAVKEATKLPPEQTPRPIRPKEIKVTSETGAFLKEEEIPRTAYPKKPTEMETRKEEANQKNVALATVSPIEQKIVLETSKVNEKETSVAYPQQQTKLEDEKREVQVKQSPAPPRQVKKVDKKEDIKKELFPVTKIDQSSPITREETNTKPVKIKEETPIPVSKKQPESHIEKKENAKEEFLSELTPDRLEKPEAKAESKATVVEKQASTSPLTKKTIKLEAKKKEVTSKDIGVIPPVEEDALYTIQVASYKNERDAEHFAENLKLKGYLVFVKQGAVPGKGIWYRVRVGAFKTIKEAKLFASALKNQEKEIQSFLITEND